MKRVEVLYQPMKRYPKIYIEGKAISRFSDLSQCEGMDMHLCADRFFRYLESEINDTYNLYIRGHRFIIALLMNMAQNRPLCTAAKGEELTSVFSAKEEAKFLCELLNEHGDLEQDPFAVAICGSYAQNVTFNDAVLTSQGLRWKIENDFPQEVDEDCSVLVIDSSEISVNNLAGYNAVVLPTEYVNDFFEYYQNNVQLIPFIEAARYASKHMPLVEAELLTLEAYRDQKPKYRLSFPSNTIDIGRETECILNIYPESATGAFALQVSPPGAARILSNTIKGEQAGDAELVVCDEEGTVIDRLPFRVIEHTYVKDILVFPEKIEVLHREKAMIEAYVMPKDAEDADALQWQITDEHIAILVDNRVVLGCQPGETSLIVKGYNCSKTVPIIVQPKLKGISVRPKSIEVEIGKTVTIECITVPVDAECSDLVWQLDNLEIGRMQIAADKKSCTIIASMDRLASGTLKCFVPNTNMSDYCRMTVTKLNRPVALINTASIFFAIGALLSFLIPLAWASGSGVSGYIMDFFLPLSFVLSIIGRLIDNENSNKTFNSLIKWNLIITVIMFALAATCCN